MKKQKHHNQFVRCFENIQDLSLQEKFEYVVVLGGGLVVSRKTIRYNTKTKKYEIYNHIDDSKLKLTEKELKSGKHSNIYEAMQKRSLIAEIA
jgi:shikimate kinase